ncbi:uncharacterized protein MONBRDRAFT_5470 [Monosiga brevicollis MX1]|uniref:TLDc domain-containing protein n=1 Tax=Monosiga brevicollis TaxID=81824 RepID=A9UNI8_MONBE|nr:uncharacterized protein MONBRDRAFT_5470 [Monosiga brevicollis MX1]EDQ92701.1 predicted protein [Monosiga brevicollis MX1]|eukprot:XP_001742463.1 hypothetical protein [Monosiga brevicollis MX1]
MAAAAAVEVGVVYRVERAFTSGADDEIDLKPSAKVMFVAVKACARIIKDQAPEGAFLMRIPDKRSEGYAISVKMGSRRGSMARRHNRQRAGLDQLFKNTERRDSGASSTQPLEREGSRRPDGVRSSPFVTTAEADALDHAKATGNMSLAAIAALAHKDGSYVTLAELQAITADTMTDHQLHCLCAGQSVFFERKTMREISKVVKAKARAELQARLDKRPNISIYEEARAWAMAQGDVTPQAVSAGEQDEFEPASEPPTRPGSAMSSGPAVVHGAGPTVAPSFLSSPEGSPPATTMATFHIPPPPSTPPPPNDNDVALSYGTPLVEVAPGLDAPRRTSFSWSMLANNAPTVRNTDSTSQDHVNPSAIEREEDVAIPPPPAFDDPSQDVDMYTDTVVPPRSEPLFLDARGDFDVFAMAYALDSSLPTMAPTPNDIAELSTVRRSSSYRPTSASTPRKPSGQRFGRRPSSIADPTEPADHGPSSMPDVHDNDLVLAPMPSRASLLEADLDARRRSQAGLRQRLKSSDDFVGRARWNTLSEREEEETRSHDAKAEASRTFEYVHLLCADSVKVRARRDLLQHTKATSPLHTASVDEVLHVESADSAAVKAVLDVMERLDANDLLPTPPDDQPLLVRVAHAWPLRLWPFCSEHGLALVQDAIIDTVVADLHVGNALYYFELASRLGLTEIQDAAQRLVETFPSVIFTQPGAFNVSEQCLARLVQSDLLALSEVAVWHLVTQWGLFHAGISRTDCLSPQVNWTTQSSSAEALGQDQHMRAVAVEGARDLLGLSDSAQDLLRQSLAGILGKLRLLVLEEAFCHEVVFASNLLGPELTQEVQDHHTGRVGLPVDHIYLRPRLGMHPFAQSAILSEEQGRMLHSWAGQPHLKWRRLFSAHAASVNPEDAGFAADDFNSLCGGRRPTYVVIEATNGLVFGGYTPCAWHVRDERHLPLAYAPLSVRSQGHRDAAYHVRLLNQAGLNSFLFSLVNTRQTAPQRAFAIDPGAAVRPAVHTGPHFGGASHLLPDLCVGNGCTETTG